MARDIDDILRGWDHKPDLIQARLVTASDGRQVIQVRVELGVLQLETRHRPDGKRPHGFPTYFEYLRDRADEAGEPLVLDEEQCREADREFMQFYHRRVAWMALKNYNRAAADADHTLAFMDFVRDHSPSDEWTQAHEQYRGFVLFHRTQALAAKWSEKNRPEQAINAVREGLDRLREFFAGYDLEDRMDEDGMVKQLRKIEQALREAHNIDLTLEEQLEKAVAAEQYEEAARIRDALRKRR